MIKSQHKWLRLLCGMLVMSAVFAIKKENISPDVPNDDQKKKVELPAGSQMIAGDVDASAIVTTKNMHTSAATFVSRVKYHLAI